ncbi:saccharopine dehydrogenase protein (plasmid) [Rhizobium phaseoli]|nr:saccharopine dehydrogenase protein [Rhizobium phaseoli]EGE60985.1 saccharopine dehydrogenase [Rhizobium etli CNPAF512]PDS74005.1 saccharopine dehydrogenase [Rhizobium phaseoli]PWI51585.1 saccharopine dehydrogenase [Rhizobium phaseoli]
MEAAMSPVIMLVGAGHMGRSALAILARSLPSASFVVVDRSTESLRLGEAIAPERIATRQVDISSDGLDASGMDLVVNLAGPFFLGSDGAARAAIAAGAAYIDVGDDAEGTTTILALDESAKSGNVPVITGAGLSPGVSNWLACSLLESHPDLDGVKIVWITREPDPGGLAVLRHMLHMAVAPCPTWRNGRMEFTKGFVPETAESFDVPPPFHRIEAYDTAHPEPVTLGRFRPDLSLVQCKGSLFPNWANAAFSTIGRIGFGHSNMVVEIDGKDVQPIEVLWKLLWKRHELKPSAQRISATQVNVIGTRGNKPIVMKSITDAGDMSRGTGLGISAAALSLLQGGVPAGANGVEAIPYQSGIDRFLRLASDAGCFADGVVTTRF